MSFVGSKSLTAVLDLKFIMMSLFFILSHALESTMNLPDPRALTERHNSYWLKLHQLMCELQHLAGENTFETLSINTTACCRQAGYN